LGFFILLGPQNFFKIKFNTNSFSLIKKDIYLIKVRPYRKDLVNSIFSVMIKNIQVMEEKEVVCMRIIDAVTKNVIRV